MLAVGGLAASLPALAARTPARTPGSPPARSAIPGLHSGLRLSILPGPARTALAPVGKSKELFGVYCNNASDCWAVGEITTAKATVNQVLHWTGKQWFGVNVPNQAGTAKGDLNELFAVRCTSLKNCWAVGDSQRPGGVAELDQALHYDGKKWAVVQTAAPGGTAGGAFNFFNDIACTSASDCWAAGEYGLVGMSGATEVGFNQAQHWNGKMWTFRKTPNPGGHSMGDINGLDGVRCTAPNLCWAGGTEGNILKGPNLRNEILLWDGKKWSVVKVPSPAGTGKLHISIIDTLACTAKDNCWAVGVTGNLSSKKQFEHNEALHWNGKHWTAVKTPNPDRTDDQLFGVTCVAAQDCWAVGSVGSRPGLNEALHWNGAKWTVVHTVNGGGTGKTTTNTLSSVRCTSHSNCWAVGRSQTDNKPGANQILHWNGTKWQDS